MAKAKKDEVLTEETMIRVQGWARDGLTAEEIADNLGVSRSTLYNWKAENKALDAALRAGRDVADRNVENALYQEALKGNTTAMIFWLKNRKPQEWRDGKALEMSGAVDTGTHVTRIVFGGEDDDSVTNAYYLAAKRWKRDNGDELFNQWKQNHLNEYDEMVAACQKEIDEREARKAAVE